MRIPRALRFASRTATALLLGLSAAPSWAHLSVIRQGRESAETPESLDLFGSTLCSGDFNGDGYEDLATGAPYETLEQSSGSAHGVVVINWGSALGLTHESAQLLIPPTSQTGLLYGSAMTSADFDGDGFDDLVVGMPHADKGAAVDAGAIVVYRGGTFGIVLNPVTYYTDQLAGSPETGDRFGFSMDAGDFDGDGHPDLIVGSPGEDSDAGAVFFVFGSGSGLTTSGAFGVKQSNFGGTNVAGDLFGYSVAIGHFTGLNPLPPSVNPNDVVVGAPGKDDPSVFGATNIGSAFLFASTNSGPQTSLVTQYSPVTLNLAGMTEADRGFGRSLAVGDFLHGGYQELVIGRPGSPTRSGECIVMSGSAFGLNFANLFSSSVFGIPAAAGDGFATSLAAGDYDGDGFEELLAGSPGYSQPQTAVGRAYLFVSTTESGLDPHSSYGHLQLNTDFAAFDQIGSAVAFGRFDDSGRASLALGAPTATDAQGEVHIVAPWRQPGTIACRNSIAFDCNDRIVYSQRPFDSVYTASSAKTMTILLAAERTQLDPGHPDYVSPTTFYVVPDWVANDIGGSQVYLVEGEILTLRTLMDMTMAVSGNDAAFAIADLLTGSNAVFNGYYDTVNEFVAEMNARALQIGMFDTTFTNPAGLSGPEPESTPYDMALLGREAIRNELFESVVDNPSWDLVRFFPDGQGGTVSVPVTLAGGFVANMQGWLPQTNGAKDGGTPKAGKTAVFTAREDHAPWGIAYGGTFQTPTSSGHIPDAAEILELALDRCFTGPYNAAPDPSASTKALPNLIPNLNVEYNFGLYPPDPFEKEGILELHNQVLDGLTTEVELRVERETTTAIPNLATAHYGTKGVTGHDGIVFVNEGIGTCNVIVQTNTAGNPSYNLVLLPGASVQIPGATLPGTAPSLQMSLFATGTFMTNLRVTERYTEAYVLGSDDPAPTKDSMVFVRDAEAYTEPMAVRVRLLGQDTDPGHLVGLVLRAPAAGYELETCPGSAVHVGAGWSGRYGVPALEVDETPLLGEFTNLRFGNSLLEPTIGVWVLGTQPAFFPTPLAGTLNLAPSSWVTVPLPADGFEFAFWVPDDAGLCGVSLYNQLLVVDPFATDGLAFSRGLRLRFGH